MDINSIYYGFLAFLQTILVWPFSILVFIFVFRKNISKLIDDIKELTVNGNTVTRTSQGTTPEAIRDVEGEARAEVTHSVSDNPYKIPYLNLFLSNNSVMALKWFADNGPKTRSEFYSEFSLINPTGRTENDEKNIIVQVLEENELLEEVGHDPVNPNFNISEEGREFLRRKGI